MVTPRHISNAPLPSPQSMSGAPRTASSSSSSAPSAAYPAYARPNLAAPRQIGSAHRSSWPPPLLPPIDVGPSKHSTTQMQQPQQNHHHYHYYSGQHPQQHPPPHAHSAPTSQQSATSPISPSVSPVEDPRQAAQDHNSNGSSGSGQQQPATTESGMVASLTGTGRKRKRLQRACVPCHKAKRRCDGGLPCSNCDFSGRGCSYSDSHGNAVQPTARAKPPASKDESPQSSGANDYRQASAGASVATAGPAETVNAMRSLHAMAPFDALLPVSFLHGANQSTLFLSSCATAMASPRNSSASASAVAAARRLMLDEDQAAFSILDRPSADNVLGLVLLALCEARMGKLTRAVAHTAVMCRMIQQLGLPDASVSTEPFHAYELARLVAVAYTVDVVLSSLAGQSFAVSMPDLEVAAARISHMGGADAETATFAALLRSTIVFAQAVEHQRKLAHRAASGGGSSAGNGVGGSSSTTASSFADSHGSAACHRALSAWADSLPASLTFEDANLSRASRAKSSSAAAANGNGPAPSSSSSSWAWAWSLMHSFAEMAVCVLDGGGRQSSTAANNLSVLCLDTMNLDSQPSAILALLPLTFAQSIPASGAANTASAAASAVPSVFAQLQSAFDFGDWQLRRTRAFLGIPAPASGPASGSGPVGAPSGVHSSYAASAPSNAFIPPPPGGPHHHAYHPHYASRSPSTNYNGNSLGPPPPPPAAGSSSLSSLPSLRARDLSDPRPPPPRPSSVSPPQQQRAQLAPLAGGDDNGPSGLAKYGGSPAGPAGTMPPSPHAHAARRLPGIVGGGSSNGSPHVNGDGGPRRLPPMNGGGGSD